MLDIGFNHELGQTTYAELISVKRKITAAFPTTTGNPDARLATLAHQHQIQQIPYRVNQVSSLVRLRAAPSQTWKQVQLTLQWLDSTTVIPEYQTQDGSNFRIIGKPITPVLGGLLLAYDGQPQLPSKLISKGKWETTLPQLQQQALLTLPTSYNGLGMSDRQASLLKLAFPAPSVIPAQLDLYLYAKLDYSGVRIHNFVTGELLEVQAAANHDEFVRRLQSRLALREPTLVTSFELQRRLQASLEVCDNSGQSYNFVGIFDTADFPRDSQFRRLQLRLVAGGFEPQDVACAPSDPNLSTYVVRAIADAGASICSSQITSKHPSSAGGLYTTIDDPVDTADTSDYINFKVIPNAFCDAPCVTYFVMPALPAYVSAIRRVRFRFKARGVTATYLEKEVKSRITGTTINTLGTSGTITSRFASEVELTENWETHEASLSLDNLIWPTLPLGSTNIYQTGYPISDRRLEFWKNWKVGLFTTTCAELDLASMEIAFDYYTSLNNVVEQICVADIPDQATSVGAKLTIPIEFNASWYNPPLDPGSPTFDFTLLAAPISMVFSVVSQSTSGPSVNVALGVPLTLQWVPTQSGTYSITFKCTPYGAYFDSGDVHPDFPPNYVVQKTFKVTVLGENVFPEQPECNLSSVNLRLVQHNQLAVLLSVYSLFIRYTVRHPTDPNTKKTLDYYPKTFALGPNHPDGSKNAWDSNGFRLSGITSYPIIAFPPQINEFVAYYYGNPNNAVVLAQFTNFTDDSKDTLDLTFDAPLDGVVEKVEVIGAMNRLSDLTPTTASMDFVITYQRDGLQKSFTSNCVALRFTPKDEQGLTSLGTGVTTTWKAFAAYELDTAFGTGLDQCLDQGDSDRVYDGSGTLELPKITMRAIGTIAGDNQPIPGVPQLPAEYEVVGDRHPLDQPEPPPSPPAPPPPDGGRAARYAFERDLFDPNGSLTTIRQITTSKGLRTADYVPYLRLPSGRLLEADYNDGLSTGMSVLLIERQLDTVGDQRRIQHHLDTTMKILPMRMIWDV